MYHGDFLLMGVVVALGAMATIVTVSVMDLAAQAFGLESPWRRKDRERGVREAAEAVTRAVEPFGPTAAGAAALAALEELARNST